MIIQTKNKDIYFVIVDYLCTEKQWLFAAGVQPNSPAAVIASRIYSCIFGGMTNIIADYETYYKLEYRDIWKFLYWHYLIDEDTIKKIYGIYKSPQCILYGDIDAGGDYSLGSYIMSEEGFPVIKRMLTKIYKEHKI
jgi:hypothetical protein